MLGDVESLLDELMTAIELDDYEKAKIIDNEFLIYIEKFFVDSKKDDLAHVGIYLQRHKEILENIHQKKSQVHKNISQFKKNQKNLKKYQNAY